MGFLHLSTDALLCRVVAYAFLFACTWYNEEHDAFLWCFAEAGNVFGYAIVQLTKSNPEALDVPSLLFSMIAAMALAWLGHPFGFTGLAAGTYCLLRKTKLHAKEGRSAPRPTHAN